MARAELSVGDSALGGRTVKCFAEQAAGIDDFISIFVKIVDTFSPAIRRDHEDVGANLSLFRR